MSVIGSFDSSENGWLFFQVLFYDVFMLLRYDELLIKEECVSGHHGGKKQNF